MWAQEPRRVRRLTSALNNHIDVLGEGWLWFGIFDGDEGEDDLRKEIVGVVVESAAQ
jgi:hypothetical protein